MKKIFVLLFLFLPLGALYSNESDESLSGFGFNIGSLGIGLSSDARNDGYIYGHIFSFMYQSKHRLGLTISPFVYSYGLKNDNTSLLTFVNASFYYDFFSNTDPGSVYFSLRPFVSINAVDYNYPDFFELRSGLSISLRAFSVYCLDSLTVELGYKYSEIYGHRFYIQASVDLIVLIGILASGNISDEQIRRKANLPTY
jgi:hypothetical protein